jgi:hypothetical protein
VFVYIRHLCGEAAENVGQVTYNPVQNCVPADYETNGACSAAVLSRAEVQRDGPAFSWGGDGAPRCVWSWQRNPPHLSA